MCVGGGVHVCVCVIFDVCVPYILYVCVRGGPCLMCVHHICLKYDGSGGCMCVCLYKQLNYSEFTYRNIFPDLILELFKNLAPIEDVNRDIMTNHTFKVTHQFFFQNFQSVDSSH